MSPSSGPSKVLLAMSGGVDSSVAAALLTEQGHEVVGVFMRLGSPGDTLDTMVPDGAACDTSRVRIGKQGCCSVGDAADARSVASQLGIRFYVVNFRSEFGRIIDYFAEEYARGRTPNPCVRCNDWLKFGRLHEYARQIGADRVASGHYAQRLDGEDGPELWRGADADKDQSYVLFGVPRAEMGRMLLPIGGMRKRAVREAAESRGLPVFDKPDSQEICFVPDNDYAGLLERRDPGLVEAGPIVTEDGEIVGEHRGHHHYTVGQRRGLGVAADRPLYVLEKDPATNRVVVGDETGLYSGGCLAAEANWLMREAAPHIFEDWTPCLAQIRSNSPAVSAFARWAPPLDAPTPSGRTESFEVRFAEPQRAVAPGQAVALYSAARPGRVLGGGWIARPTPVQTEAITEARG